MNTRRPAPCSEFPNDNPDLHLGAIWICAGTCDRPRAELRAVPRDEVSVIVPEALALASELTIEDPPDTAPMIEIVMIESSVDEVDEDDGADIIVEELDEIVYADEDAAPPARVSEIVVVSHAKDEEGEPRVDAPRDSFALLLRTLSQVALESSGAVAANIVGAILGESRVDAEGMSEAQIGALVDGGILQRTEGGIARNDAFATTVLAWQALLRGESDDMSGCGTRMLDEWSAEIVARAIGIPAKADQLRRELRSRGVAAFGLIETAA